MSIQESVATQAPIVSVVDDDEHVRESLAALIQSMNLDVECYSSGVDFLAKVNPEVPGCIVLDLRMPQTSGLEVIDELTARGIENPVIMISGHGDIPAAVSAMKAGAVDFLEKPYRGSALMESIRLAIESDGSRRAARAGHRELLDRFAMLTEEEKEVLRLTADGKPDKAIALKLDLSLRTIQLRRAALMRKLQVATRAQLIRLAQVLDAAMIAS